MIAGNHELGFDTTTAEDNMSLIAGQNLKESLNKFNVTEMGQLLRDCIYLQDEWCEVSDLFAIVVP